MWSELRRSAHATLAAATLLAACSLPALAWTSDNRNGAFTTPVLDGKGDTGKNMSQQYQKNLIRFWIAVASYPGIKGAANVHFEICNKPISIETRFGRTVVP